MSQTAPSLPRYVACDGMIVERDTLAPRVLPLAEARARCARYRSLALSLEHAVPSLAAHCRSRFVDLHAALSAVRAAAQPHPEAA